MINDIYKEEFNQELITKQLFDFKINIIYVLNEVKCAVNNPKIKHDYINSFDLEKHILHIYKHNNYEIVSNITIVYSHV